jgi:hypothetical protein
VKGRTARGALGPIVDAERERRIVPLRERDRSR